MGNLWPGKSAAATTACPSLRGADPFDTLPDEVVAQVIWRARGRSLFPASIACRRFRDIVRSDPRLVVAARLRRPVKVVVVGDCGTGSNTSFLFRLKTGKPMVRPSATIGVDFVSIERTSSDGFDVVLQLWDIAGSERFGYMTPIYYGGARAAILGFDVSRPCTFAGMQNWNAELESKAPPGIPKILLANKCDLLTGDGREALARPEWSRRASEFCMHSAISPIGSSPRA